MKRVVLAASAVLVLVSGGVLAAPSYLVTDLGRLLNATRINDSGWVVGQSYTVPGTIIAPTPTPFFTAMAAWPISTV